MKKLILIGMLLILLLSVSVQAATTTYAVKNGQSIISTQQPQGCCTTAQSNNNAVEYFTIHQPPQSVFPYQKMLITPEQRPCCQIMSDSNTYHYTMHYAPTLIRYHYNYRLGDENDEPR